MDNFGIPSSEKISNEAMWVYIQPNVMVDVLIIHIKGLNILKILLSFWALTSWGNEFQMWDAA